MRNIIEYFEITFKGLLSGFFIAYLLLLGLRPAVMYPDNILDIIDNPWVFLILLIVNYYIYLWDDTIGILMFLTLIALLLDIIIFTEGGFFKENIHLEIFSNNTYEDVNKVEFAPPVQKSTSTYKDINRMILDQLKKMQNTSSEILAINAPAPFIK